jgi:hypothetical protein
MKLWKLAATVAVGVFASGSGALQVNAALFQFFVNFEDKIVTDFDDFRQSYISTTYDLGATITFDWQGIYSFETAPAPISVDVRYESSWRLNGVGTLFNFLRIDLPDFLVTTTRTSFAVQRTVAVSDQFVSAVIDDDANFAQFRTNILFVNTAQTNGLKLRLESYTKFVTLNYNFDTTYLFNYFLSDTQAALPTRGGSWTIGSDFQAKNDFVYTTAGNDEYRIVNTGPSIGTTRKKYAIDYNNEYFRGNSVGARVRTFYDTDAPFTYDELLMTSSGVASILTTYNYYFLNTSNFQQDIANVPTFEFETEDCGGFLAVNVPCFINNALAYIVNDAPVISDAFTLLNAGMRLGGQAFGIIGNFSTDNLFGVMILGGLGITAVRWFLKND